MNTISDKEVRDFVEWTLQNPFSGETSAKNALSEDIFQEFIDNNQIYALTSSIPVKDNKSYLLKLVLAYGIIRTKWDALNKSNVFQADTINRILDDTFKKKKEKIQSLVIAAGNCFRFLMEEIAGNSTEIVKTKAETWRACFGNSLYEALLNEPIIRRQNIIFIGETGTGKELFAEAIKISDFTGKDPKKHDPVTLAHRDTTVVDPSKRNNQISLNIAALDEELALSELFGHKKGAFTGATSDRDGAFKRADKGILFLDEIGDLSEIIQVKLLRAIEYGKYHPMGSDKEKIVDIRFVSATNKDINDPNVLRLDLKNRVAGWVIKIPPLRRRTSDIKLIVESLLHKWLPKNTHLKSIKSIIGELPINNYEWPGNVRELSTMLRRVILGDSVKELNSEIIKDSKYKDISSLDKVVSGEMTIDEVKSWYVNLVREQTGSLEKAANKINVCYSTAQKWSKNG